MATGIAKAIVTWKSKELSNEKLILNIVLDLILGHIYHFQILIVV